MQRLQLLAVESPNLVEVIFRPGIHCHWQITIVFLDAVPHSRHLLVVVIEVLMLFHMPL